MAPSNKYKDVVIDSTQMIKPRILIVTRNSIDDLLDGLQIVDQVDNRDPAKKRIDVFEEPLEASEHRQFHESSTLLEPFQILRWKLSCACETSEKIHRCNDFSRHCKSVLRMLR